MRSDPAVVAALPAWSTCLTAAVPEAGRTGSAGPPASPEDLGALVTQVEVDGGDSAALAWADAQCRSSSGLGAAVRSVAVAAEAVVTQRAASEGGAWAALRG